MAEIIDTRSSDGYLVVLGSALTLPNSNSNPSNTFPPFRGSLRYNPNTGTVQLFITSWNDIGSGGGGGGGLESVTLTGDATGTTNAQGTIPVVLATISTLTAGTYNNVSVDAKGRVVKAKLLTPSDITTALTYTPANVQSPTFSGTPAAPTPPTTDNSTRLATTAYVQANISKIFLTNSLTFYVSPSGSDNNTGTQSSPFATVTHAYSLLVTQYSLNGKNVVIQVEDGAYTSSIVLAGVPDGLSQNSISIIGNSTTPANVIINPTNGNSAISVNGANVTVSGFTLQSANQNAFFLRNNASLSMSSIVFGPCPNGYHIQTSSIGSYVNVVGPYSVVGAARCHYVCTDSGEIFLNSSANPISVAQPGGGTMNFPQGFATAASGGNIYVASGVTFSVAGNTTVNAVRSVVSLNGVINTNNQGGASYFPGNSIGTQQTGGQYA